MPVATFTATCYNVVANILPYLSSCPQPRLTARTWLVKLSKNARMVLISQLLTEDTKKGTFSVNKGTCLT